MSETLTYIDGYFSGSLTADERLAFEKRCEQDESFAEEVAFYVASRDALKNELQLQKKEEFAELYRQLVPAQKQVSIIRKLGPYITAAAACLVLFFAWMVFLKPSDPQKLASEYVEENFSTLGITMGAAKDSLQTGITAYNEKNYPQAEKIFRALAQNPEVAPDAIKYLGIVYLNTHRYDEAIVQFDTLSKYEALFANPALFYKAIVLMKRSAPGDREAAKDLLEEVVEKDLSGSKEAREWLNKL
jgi:tetratricopeptide (TPR) repeat protein